VAVGTGCTVSGLPFLVDTVEKAIITTAAVQQISHFKSCCFCGTELSGCANSHGLDGLNVPETYLHHFLYIIRINTFQSTVMAVNFLLSSYGGV